MINPLIFYSLCGFGRVLVSYHLGCVPKEFYCDVVMCSKQGEKDTSEPCVKKLLPAVASVEGSTIDTRSMSMGAFFYKPLVPHSYLVVKAKECSNG